MGPRVTARTYDCTHRQLLCEDGVLDHTRDSRREVPRDRVIDQVPGASVLDEGREPADA